jgi:ThiF family
MDRSARSRCAETRMLEPDHIDLTNLNRYSLARRSQVGNSKIEALASWQTSNLSITGERVRVDRTTLVRLTPLAERVLIGTDDIPSRWLVQRQRPRWLGVGATAHFQTVTSEHPSGQPCAGCLHPEDDDVTAPIPTISFTSYWAGLSLAALLLNNLAGARPISARQTIEVASLQVGSARGIWWHPVHRSPHCPVRCQLS